MSSRRSIIVGLLAAAAVPLVAETARGQGWLDAARWHVPFSSVPGEFHYIADFDGNGFDDLVWFDDTPNQAQYLWTRMRVDFNDGTGDLPGQGPTLTFPVNGNRWYPVVYEGVRRLQDVTGDLIPDVFVREYMTGSMQVAGDVALHVYPGRTNGSFGAPISIPLYGVGQLDGIALGQIDADPVYEIGITVRQTIRQTVFWLDWNGSGFTASPTVDVPVPPFFPRATKLVAFDLEGDGDDDLAYGQLNGNELRVFPTVGGAPTMGQVIGLAIDPYADAHLHVADLAGGGTEDVLVAYSGPQTSDFGFIPVLNVGGVLAPGAVQPMSYLTSLVHGGAYELGDWDEDGDVDAMYYPWDDPGTPDDGIVAFFENDGVNGFTGPVEKAETIYAGFGPIAASDFDQDGHLDLVLSQTTFFGRGRFESTLVPIPDGFFGAIPRAIFDLEGDGDLDLYLESSRVYLNDGTGRFETIVGSPAPPAGLTKRRPCGIGDFDGDGRVDFLTALGTPGMIFVPAAFQEMRLYTGTALGGFSDAGVVNPLSMEPFYREINVSFDVDADGDLDLLDVTTNGGYWPNNGNGTFAPHVSLFGSFHEPSAMADLDGDADADVITTQTSTNGLYLERNQGGLAFSTSAIIVATAPVDSNSVTLGDMDNDGDLDLAAAYWYGNEATVFANDGSAGFAQTAVLSTSIHPIGADAVMTHMTFDDVDGDGIADLFCGGDPWDSEDVHHVMVFRGLGGGAFEPTRIFAAEPMGVAGDVDGDGDVDLSGSVVVRSRRFDGEGAGVIRQYGQGTPGTGGAVPVLGAAGPLRPGSTTAELRLRRARGGAKVVLLYGLNEGATPNSPVLGATLYVDPPIFSLNLVASGALGAVAAGELDLPLGPVLAQVAGFTIYMQAATIDPAAPGSLATTNGLRLTFGI